MCRVLRVSKSGYYEYLQNKVSKRSLENEIIIKEIRKIHIEVKEVYGSPRMSRELKNREYKCSENKVSRLMKKHKIYSKMKKKRKPITTICDKTKLASPNLINQKFEVSRKNRIWTSDITYIPTKEGWLYLAVIMDIYSRNIIGWSIAPVMKADLIIQALNNAIVNRQIKETKNIILHSDRGSQYTSNEFRELLKSKNIIQSMSGKGNCYDNAVTETFFHSLKVELVNHVKFVSFEHAKNDIFKYIECFYKTKRLHSYLGYLSPVQFEQIYSFRE